MKKSIALFCSLLLLFPAACASVHAPSLTEASAKYHPAKIASGVPARPGSVSWSPDGRRLAFISNGLRMVDVESGGQRAVAIDNPSYIAWAADKRTLYAVVEKKGRNALCSIDAVSLAIKEIFLDSEADAIYPSADNGKLLIFSTSARNFDFGTELSYRVFAFELSNGTTKTLYASSKIHPMTQLDMNVLLAWTHAGVSPLDNSLLIIEHVKPPAVASYSRVNSLDTMTGETGEISDQQDRKSYVSASWSPDGRRLALSLSDGRIELRNLHNEETTLGRPVTGFYPSWNPRGSMIYTGGYLVDSDGKNSEALFKNAFKSISWWSPDGTKLAVAAGNILTLFSGLTPSLAPPDRPLDTALSTKLSVLRNLLQDGLLNGQEYRERKDRLIKNSEGLR